MAHENSSLTAAKKAKNDEFYTQYADIEAEMNAYYEYNHDVFRDKVVLLPCDDPEWSEFTRFFASRFDKWGLKKLISTSYAKSAGSRRLTDFERESEWFDEERHGRCGKLFVLERDVNGDGRIDNDDIEFWGYLDGDGDFRSDEVTRLRDEADIVVTNPPFSLLREFVAWLMAGKKRFVIVGNKNMITYKEIFPLLKDNEMWLGPAFPNGNAFFRIISDDVREFANGVYDGDTGLVKFRNVGWFTNIDHGGRHEPLRLSTMADNLKYNKKLRRKLEKDYGKLEYPYYDNYDALEVPLTECIPSDYEPGYLVPVEYRPALEAAGVTLGHERENSRGEMCVCVCVDEGTTLPGVPTQATEWCSGVMGVPITFMDKYNPDQFEITGITLGNTVDYSMTRIYEKAVQHNRDGSTQGGGKVNTRAAVLVDTEPTGTVHYSADNVDGYLLSIYPRVLIRTNGGAYA